MTIRVVLNSCRLFPRRTVGFSALRCQLTAWNVWNVWRDWNDLTTAWINMNHPCVGEMLLSLLCRSFTCPGPFQLLDFLAVSFTAEAVQLQDHHTQPVCIAWGQNTTGHSFHWQRQIASGLPISSNMVLAPRPSAGWKTVKGVCVKAENSNIPTKTVDEHANVGYIMPYTVYTYTQ